MSQTPTSPASSGLPVDFNRQPHSWQEVGDSFLSSPTVAQKCDVLDVSIKIHQCDSWDQLPELCARAICSLMGAVDARWLEISANGNKTLWAYSSSKAHAVYVQKHIKSMESRASELGRFYHEMQCLLKEQSDKIISLKSYQPPEELEINPYVNDFLKPVNVVDLISIQLFSSAGGSVILCLGMPAGEVSQKQLNGLKFIREHIRTACAKLSRLASFVNLTDALKQRWQAEKSVGISVLSNDGETLWEADDVSVKRLQDLGGKINDEGVIHMPAEMAAWAKSVLTKNTRICAQTGEHSMLFEAEPSRGITASLLLERAGSGALLVLKRDKQAGEYGGVFTRRELDVIRCIVDGMTSHEVSEALHISKRTVDKHLENVYTKLGVNNRLAAMKRLQEV